MMLKVAGKLSLTLSTAFFLSAATALPVLPFASDAGLERLAQSKHKADFFKLATYYRFQTDRIVCGPTTGAIVLNALRYGKKAAPLIELPQAFLDQMPIPKNKKEKFDPRIHAYTPENFLNEAARGIKSLSRVYAEPVDGARDAGVQLEQLKRMLDEAHKTNVTKMVVGTTDRATKVTPPLARQEFNRIVAEMISNLGNEGDYVIANYSRSVLKQPGFGHISPVAAYHEDSHSFLILDTSPPGTGVAGDAHGGPWAWVNDEDLLNAMNTFDTEENRGLLFVSEKPSILSSRDSVPADLFVDSK